MAFMPLPGLLPDSYELGPLDHSKENPDSDPNQIYLRLLECPGQPILWESFAAANVTILEFCSCQGMTRTPANIGGLSYLRELQYTACVDLVSISSEVWELPLLETVGISACDGITSLPDGITQANSLKNLEIVFCEHFCKLPTEITSLPCLEKLNVSGCKQIEEIPSGDWPALKKLEFRFCTGLMTIPSHFSNEMKFNIIDKSINLNFFPSALWKSIKAPIIPYWDHQSKIAKRMFEGDRLARTILSPVDCHGYRAAADAAGIRRATPPPQKVFIRGIFDHEIFYMLLCARRADLPQLPTELWLDIADTLYEMHLAELLPCLAD